MSLAAMTTFTDLLSALPFPYTLTGDGGVPVTAPVVEADGEVQPGGVFVARGGLTSDGHRFIPAAIARGAAAVVGEQPLADLPVPYAQVAQAQEAIGYLAAAYHGFPSRRLRLIGVTGTDGKTTTSTLIHRILQEMTGGKAGLISTIAAEVGSAALDTGFHVTTPGAPQTQALLAQIAAGGLTDVVLEMTSHGLAQGRLNGVEVDAAVITNLTHEHLDYHGTFENYRAAKGRLFAMLGQAARKPGVPKIAVVNADDPNAEFFAAFPADRLIRYGVREQADVRATDIVFAPAETRFRLRLRGQDAGDIRLRLAGQFNVMNALAAIAVTTAHGATVEQAQRGLWAVERISGRMERIDEGQAYLALVDFAHTPNALANALQTARAMTGAAGRVIAVFGSAGLRDRDKRRLMAEVAARLADLTVLTAEDPRTESLDEILATMTQAATAAGAVEGETLWRVPDRGAALAFACGLARAGDVVIACGKGHEQSMCFGDIEYPWDDREALRAALRGAPLTTLPTAL
jgi:UDP-N-acetylmuramoyl-L-alanyl-D-glutamate--2,6-diaminopimelate ligase